ncbi:unnamed protein product [Ixodes pacificus]
MSPGTLESQGLINQSEYQKYLTLSSSPETHKKISGFIAKVKDTAETAASRIQAKAESVGIKTSQTDVSGASKVCGSAYPRSSRGHTLFTQLQVNLIVNQPPTRLPAKKKKKFELWMLHDKLSLVS